MTKVLFSASFLKRSNLACATSTYGPAFEAVLPLKRLLHHHNLSQSVAKICKDLQRFARIQFDAILPLALSYLVMPIIDCITDGMILTSKCLHFERWIPSKRLLVVEQHWMWQRTGDWAVIHGPLEIDGTGCKFVSETMFLLVGSAHIVPIYIYIYVVL